MNYFIDTSSLVKIYHPESGSEKMFKMYTDENGLLLSELSVIEFLTTIQRKHREREINTETRQLLFDKFNEDAIIRDQVLKFTGEVRATHFLT